MVLGVWSWRHARALSGEPLDVVEPATSAEPAEIVLDGVGRDDVTRADALVAAA